MGRLRIPPIPRAEAERICALGAALFRGEMQAPAPAEDDEEDAFGLVENLCGYEPAPCGECGTLVDPADLQQWGRCLDCRMESEWDDAWDEGRDLPF